MNKNGRKRVRAYFRGFASGKSELNSPFRSMWLIVTFDLPVGSREEKRNATRFRNLLLDEGFNMKQFSVYQKYYENRAKAESAANRIGKQTPKMGSVSTIFLTDKQIGMVRNYYGGRSGPKDEKPPQLALF